MPFQQDPLNAAAPLARLQVVSPNSPNTQLPPGAALVRLAPGCQPLRPGTRNCCCGMAPSRSRHQPPPFPTNLCAGRRRPSSRLCRPPLFLPNRRAWACPPIQAPPPMRACPTGAPLFRCIAYAAGSMRPVGCLLPVTTVCSFCWLLSCCSVRCLAGCLLFTCWFFPAAACCACC